jgi:AraC-like DNA-binding protein
MTKMPESADLLLQTRPDEGFVAEPVAIWKARKYIQERSDEDLPLTRVASFVKTNPNYFSEKFKEVTGLNFIDYLAHIRIANAIELLRDKDLRVSEIAFAVGFQSLSQFNRVFKRICGRSPTEFRLAHTEQRTGSDFVRSREVTQGHFSHS